MIFGIDPDAVYNPIVEALEYAGAQVSEQQFIEIAEAINKSLPDVVDHLAYATYENWKAKAESVSTGWGGKYSSGIKVKDGEVYLDEEMIDKQTDKPVKMFAEMIEKGQNSFSIRDALLKSEKAKTGVDNDGNTVKYISVPFPVRTPKTNKKTKMSSEFQGRAMTQAMYRIVKAGGKITSGSIKAKGKDVDIAGLSKYRTPQRHSGYGIFRRVSSNTPSDKWRHPGRGAEPVLQSVKNELNTQIHKALSAFCWAIVHEHTG